ncbi:MAG: tetratricopeptide repeat protein, partial [Pseudobdellovibrionaceae bacterium]
MLKIDYKLLISECDSEIRAGQVPQARRRLKQTSYGGVPRELALPLANICRRVGLITLGLRILSPLIHPEKHTHSAKASDAEVAEFAVLLQRCGAVDEAIELLSKIDSKNLPEVKLYKTFCLFNRWEYADAIDEIRDYLKFELTPYAQMVGRVNLGAALIATDRYEEAIHLLCENIAFAKKNKFRRLEGNCFELRGQAQTLIGNFKFATEDLEVASQILFGEKVSNELAITKWQAVIKSTQTKSAIPLHSFKKLALENGDYEGVRHSDLHTLKIDFDPSLFRHLLFGSPWNSFRKSTQTILGQSIAEQDFIFGSEKTNIFDLATGQIERGSGIPAGGSLHRLLNALLIDFYRPIRTGALFSKMFPGEKFNIFSSPGRIHQVLFRGRA